jgi:hypothetical protein
MNLTKKKNERLVDEVKEKSRSLITEILNQTLPIENIHQNFVPHKDADYRSLLSDYENYLTDFTPSELKLRLKKNHPEPLHESIAYDYFLLVIRALVDSLRDFGCYNDNDILQQISKK